jgi:integrase
MEDKLTQEHRGRWKRRAGDRGVYLRGKRWYVRYTDQHGKIHVEAVGPSKATALDVYKQRKAAVIERRFVPTSGVLWDELVADVLAVKEQEHRFAKIAKPFKPGNYAIIRRWFAGRRADSITNDEIRQRLADAKSPGTYNRKRNSLNKVFRVAVENKKLVLNPIAVVRPKRENNSRVRYLNQLQPDEEQRLRDAVRKLSPEREAEIDLALYTGMRWAEQYTLAWKNVDLVERRITLPRTKSGEEQYIKLNQSAYVAILKLRGLYPNAKLVCPGAGYYNDFKRKFWNLVVTEAKLVDFHWHDLRHTFASRLATRSGDIYAVSKLMRHSNVKTTERYAHLADERLAAVSALLDEPSVIASVQTAERRAYLQ